MWYVVKMQHDNSPVGHLIVDRQSPRLRETLWDLIRRAKGDDVLAPVTVVGPNRYANLSLRHELGLNGFANVRFIVLNALSELLGAAALAAAGRLPLTGTLEGVSMRTALSGATGALAPVSGHPSTQASVRATFRELRKAPAEVLEGLEAQDGVRSEIVRLYRTFRQTTIGDWYDTEDLAEAAADAVRRDDTPGLDNLGAIVFYLPRDVSPAQGDLMQDLARQGRCAVLLGTTGDSEADGPTLALAQTLKAAFAAPQNANRTEDPSTDQAGETALHIAPNAHEELRWVIRQIIGEAQEHRTSFHRMAILYRAENPYSTLIADELALAGIPMAGPGRESLADSGVGRTLLGLLDLASREFRRADVMAWLTGCPVRPPTGRAPGFNPSHWDSLTRRAGVVSGLEQWNDRLNRFANDLDDTAKDRLEKDEISEARAERMQYEATAARNAASFVETLSADLQPPHNGSSWSAFSDWAQGLLTTYLSREARNDTDTTFERVVELLEGLKAADSISPSTTLDVFRQTIEEGLRAPMGQLGPTGGGVFVSSFATAAGMSFDAVWMVGMIEGAVPPAIRPDPLIPETGWQLAGGRSRAAQRVASERCDFLSALASAPRRTLSYPVADGGSQRQAYPSRWFFEQAAALEGNPVHTGDLPRLRDRPWMTTTDSAEQALAAPLDTALADRHDYMLRRLLHWKRSGGRVSRHPLLQTGTPLKAITASLSRNLRRFTEFDGNLSAMAGAGIFQAGLAQSPVSPTRLESWGRCPFSYFLGHALRLSALETPEEITTISALDRGDLVHRILERFIESEVQAGQLPAPGNAWDAAARDRLFAIAEAAFHSAEERGVTGKHLLWQMAKQDMRHDLESFLEEDGKLRRLQGTGQVEVEVEFGGGTGSIEVVDPDSQLRFRGKIDRLDISSDGQSVLVLDYKTGSSSPYSGLKDDVIDGGKRLQLGVYSLAAQQIVPGASSVRAAYWFATTRGGFQFAPADHFDITHGEVRERFQQGVNTIVDGIRSGLFPANPGQAGQRGPANCQFCDFNTLCPARREEMWERKKSDPSLAGYVSLSAPSEEEEEA